MEYGGRCDVKHLFAVTSMDLRAGNRTLVSISERGVIEDWEPAWWSGVNIHGCGKSPPSLLRLWGLLALVFWPEGKGMLDMEAE